MRLNLNNSCLLVLLITVFILPKVKAETNDQLTKVTLRAIGNEFLLQLNDSTSRVLPIEMEEGRYAVKFERNFSFEPDLLFFSVFKTLEDSDIKDSFIVEVEECESKLTIHSFEAGLTTKGNEIACKKRLLPEGCYVFYFTFRENKEELFPEKKSREKSSLFWYLVVAFVIGLLIFLYFKFIKKEEEIDTNIYRIGKFVLDKKGMTLSINNESTVLSTKESDLLFLLFFNENKTIEREHILQEIWEDEGNYVGRTLDVFISKLRKKLEADPAVKIINVRGVGYKMVIN